MMNASNDSLTLQDMCFVGLNGRVMGLNRYTGAIAWEWKSPKGRSQFVSLMLDGDRLLVSSNGYLYCLDPLYGQEVWSNELKGYGVGIASFASANGNNAGGGAASIIAAQQAAAVAASTAAASGAAAAG